MIGRPGLRRGLRPVCHPKAQGSGAVYRTRPHLSVVVAAVESITVPLMLN